MTWICGLDSCRAVRAGLGETIISSEELARLRAQLSAAQAERDRLKRTVRELLDTNSSDEARFHAELALAEREGRFGPIPYDPTALEPKP